MKKAEKSSNVGVFFWREVIKLAKKAEEQTATPFKLDPTAALRRFVENNQKGFLADQKNSQIEQAEGTLRDLTAKLAATVKNLVPKCHQCGFMDIQVRKSVHTHHLPGPMIIGPGGRGSTWTSVSFDCLYCEGCGTTYFNSKISAKISVLLVKIHDVEVRLFNLKHPHLC